METVGCSHGKKILTSYIYDSKRNLLALVYQEMLTQALSAVSCSQEEKLFWSLMWSDPVKEFFLFLRVDNSVSQVIHNALKHYKLSTTGKQTCYH